jgi:TonB family protein
MKASAALTAVLVGTLIALAQARADSLDQNSAPPSGYGISGAAAVAAYPAAALKAGTPGEAIVTCERDASGKPHDCRLTSEAPAGQGFGDAALTLMNEAAPEGEMLPPQRKALPFRFLFKPDSPTITPDVFHTARPMPYLTYVPTSEESVRAATGVHLSGPGGAKVDCWIGVDGHLTDCTLVTETPPGSGWGALELKLLPLDRFGVFTREGFPATGMKVGVDTSPSRPATTP